MSPTRLFLAAIAACGLTVAVGAGATHAQRTAPPVFVDPSLKLDDSGPVRPLANDAPVSLVIRLSGPSISQQLASSKAATRVGGSGPLASPALGALRSEMTARQAPARAGIEQAGAQVIDSFQTATNGFLVHAKPSQVAALARIPGVARIERAPLMSLELAHSIPQIGATKVWQDLGWDGTGSIVAIIDTGTDYTHKDFGGPGTTAAYQSNDPRVIEPGTFPTAKVIGGVDLVGEIYSASCPPPPHLPPLNCTAVPEPDDDPLDSANVLHGTHVAGIVAGQGIAGTDLGPGAAPGAKIVSIKVFGDPTGSPGDTSTDMVMSAIEWATEHNLGMVPDIGVNFTGKIDVMNLSLGSPWGGESAVGNETVDAAVEAGITVVMSGGNEGNIPMIVGSNGTAEHALSVASSLPTGQQGYYITADWTESGAAKQMQPDAVALSDGWLPDLAEVGKKTAPLAWYGLACSGEDGTPETPVQDLREKFALIERGDCNISLKVQNAGKFGAVGVIMFTNANPKATRGCDPCDNLPDIPGVMIDRAPGIQLEDMLVAGTKVMATLDPSTLYDLGDIISDFSSRGPSRGQLAIKPQITAPGTSIVSAECGTGTGSISLSGTSMSGPTVAGVAALLWQRNRAQKLDLGALEIAALAMNYAPQVIVDMKSHFVPNPPVSGVPLQGAGRVDAYRSATGNTLLRSADGIAELGFAMPQVTKDQVRLEKKVNVLNMGKATKQYKLANQYAHADDANQGVSLSFEPASFSLEAGKDTDVTVTAVVTASQLRDWNMRSHEVLWDADKLSRLEIDGWVSFTEVDAGGVPVAGGDLATMPFYVLPRRQSCTVTTTKDAFDLAKQGDMTNQTWTNACPQIGVVQPLLLGGQDPAESVGDPNWPPKIDIQAIGTTYGPEDPDIPTSPTVLTFAVATRGATHLPLDTQVRVYMDYNKDGKWDEVIFNILGDAVGLAGAENMFIVFHAKIAADGVTPDYRTISVPAYFQIYDINDQTALLPVAADELNDGSFDLSGGTASFNYAVRVDDDVDDYAVAGNFLGYDLAPDGMFDNKPVQYSWQQNIAECIHLIDGEGNDTGKLGDISISWPAGATNTTPFKLQLACQPPAGVTDTGVLILNMSNAQGTEAGFDVRPGHIGTPVTPTGIYLPYLSQGHAFNPTTTVQMTMVGGEGSAADIATLTQRGTKLEVVLNLPNATTDTPHPAHIHTGSCATPGGIFKDLAAVENGKSMTILDGVTLASVMDGTHYINVHKSATEMGVAISCGDIATAP